MKQQAARAARWGVARWLGGAAAALLLAGFGFRDGPSLPDPVQYHTATGLADGRVLIAGGYDGGQLTTNRTWLYEPWSGRLSAAAPMLSAHHFHTATLMRDGRVLVVAGKSEAGTGTSFTESFDPATGAWADAGNLADVRERHTATLLSDGRVLVFGDFGATAATAEVFDRGTWSLLPPAPMAQRRGEANAVRLSDGRVLFLGGQQNFAVALTDILSSTVVFDPSTSGWSAGPTLLGRRRLFSTSLLTDGGVLVLGGQLQEGSPTVFTTTEQVGAAAVAGPTMGSPRSGAVVFRMADETLAYVAGDYTAGPVDLRDPRTGLLTAGPAQSRVRFGAVGVPTVDGRLLLAGGVDLGGLSPALQTLELRTLATLPQGPVPGRRERHTATLLPDGRVFIAGGSPNARSAWWRLDDGGFADAGTLVGQRWGHTANLLPDGEVLLVGGGGEPGTAERCNPTTGCRPAAPPLHPRNRAASALLHDGRVLVVGGSVDLMSEEAMLEAYDPATDTWADAGQLVLARHQARALTLNDSRVLVAGGWSMFGTTRRTELYDPATGVSTDVGNSLSFHGDAPLVLAADGRAVLAGGSTQANVSLAFAEAWTADGGWKRLGDLPAVITNAVALLLPDDRVYLFGGSDSTFTTGNRDISRLEFLSDTFEAQPALDAGRYFQSVTLLPTGEALVVGGLTQGAVLDIVEVVRLGPLPSARLQPVLDAPAGPLAAGAGWNVSGQLLTGADEASGSGLTASASESPTFRFEREDNQALTHLAASSWTASSASLTLPPTLPPGWYRVTAIVAGISSQSVPVLVLAPDGARCASASVCLGGQCLSGRCAGAPDAGPGDAGAVDGGGGDAGGDDAGAGDAGTGDGGLTPSKLGVGCGCAQAAGLVPWALLALGLRRRRRRAGCQARAPGRVG